MKKFLLSWGLIMGSALCDSYASFIVKRKFNELGRFDFSSFPKFLEYMLQFFKSPVLITAMMTFAAAPILWFMALNRMNLSVGYPALVGFHFLFIMVFGIVFLGESFTAQKMIGLTLVIASFYFLYD